MKQVLLLIFLATVAGTYASASLKVRYGILGSKRFISMPLTVTQALTQKWVETPRPANSLLPSLILYCHESRKACVLYDDTGYIAGYQVALASTLITSTIGMCSVSRSGLPRMTAKFTMLLNSTLFQKNSKEDRLAARASDSILQLDSVWVSGTNGELMKISKKYEDIANSVFTKQSCIPGMGRHYYYNMTENLECSAETLLPWFAMVHSGRLVAIGLVVFVKMPEKNFDVLERPPKAAVKVIVPKGPECMYNLSENPGRITSHIYFDVDNPFINLHCIGQ